MISDKGSDLSRIDRLGYNLGQALFRLTTDNKCQSVANN